MSGDKFKFEKIKIEGFRGRYFELDLKNDQSNVFIMGNNTGKTTLIDLLRWCFKYSESEAKETFSHMWDEHTNVLDYKRKGIQNCKITIIFSDEEHQYKLIREAIGEHILKIRTLADGEISLEVGEDRIDEIKDLLEIDNGDEPLKGDKAHMRLDSLFRLSRCADYFCFDGEKAHEIMKASNSQSTIVNLIKGVNIRASHPLMDKYYNDLDTLKRKVLSTAKKQAGGTSQKNITVINEDVSYYQSEINKVTLENEKCEIQRDVFESNIDEIDSELQNLQSREIEIASENSRQREKLKNQAAQKEEEIEKSRAEIYSNMKEWILQDIHNNISKVKNHIRVRGKLPEPYHKSLIIDCLASHPPTCQICNRPLDAVSDMYIKKLQSVLSSETSHKFLITNLALDPAVFDVQKKRNEIRDLIGDLKGIDDNIDSIKLSDEQETILRKKTKLNEEKVSYAYNIGSIDNRLSSNNSYLRELRADLNKAIQSLDIVAKYEIILKSIENTEKTLENTKKKMEDATISIISTVISNSISLILGEQYSAILDKEAGLRLVDGGIAGKDTGGYAARLILSYCFAESMSTIDPIIVDTPSGNIDGENRINLAKHLMKNHKQLILLCIPDEINNFADHITNDYLIIENEDYDYSEGVIE